MADALSLEEYGSHDGIGLAALIRSGEVSEAEAADAARRAVEHVEPAVNGLAFPLLDEPLAHDSAGPLGGVPFLLKDLGPYAEGFPFSSGSRFFEGAVADADADIMRRFRAAGLATLGSTATPEFAFSFDTTTRRNGATNNPWNPERGVGGSSGGSAALVAAGAVPIAHATDGAGSTRVPAAFCGLVGLKPTRGRTPVDVEGLFGLAAESAVTRTVRDSAALLDAIAGPQATAKYRIAAPGGSYLDALAEAPGPLRIAVHTGSWSGGPVDPEVARAAEETAALLESMGHRVEAAGPVFDAERILRAFTMTAVLSIGTMLDSASNEPTPELIEATSYRLWEESRQWSAREVGHGFEALNETCRAAGAFFERYDVLVTPTAARTAMPHGTHDFDAPGHTVESWHEILFEACPFTGPFNIGGQPAISVPMAVSGEGLPIGVQLVAEYGRDDRVLRLAAQLEQARPWAGRAPRVHVSAPAVR
jgi:amidase